MNKKRIALALAAGLSLNALILTTAPFGGQGVVAHATQSKVVPGTENEKKVNAIDIKTLTTKVTGVNNGEVTLSIDKTNVKNATGTLTETAFGGTATSGTAAVSLNSNGTLKVTNVINPGLYTGEVTLTYNDGTTEEYALTLKKTEAKKVLSLGKVEVGVGNISFDNPTFGGATIPTGGTLKLVEKGQTKAIDTIQTADLSTDKKFTVLDIKEGIYEVVYNDGTNDVAKTEILVKKTDVPVIDIVGKKASNETTFLDDIKATIETDFGIAKASIVENPAATTSAVNEVSVKENVNNNVIFKYKQTGDGNNLGGAKISATASGSEVTINLTEFNTKNANYVPANAVTGKGTSLPNKVYLVGEQYVSVNGGSPQLYYDSKSESKFEIEGSGGQEHVTVTGGVELTTSALTTPKNPNFSTKFDVSGFSHGYTPVSVEFTAQASSEVTVAGKNQVQLNQIIGTPNQVNIGNVQNLTSKVITSVIVSKDELDGVSVNATFEKTGDNKGVITILGGKNLGDANQLPNNLTVKNGTNVGKVGAVSIDGENLKADVTFTNPISGNIEWKHSNGLSGVIDYSTTETLNFSGQVQASNKDAENLANDFYITAKLDSALPTEAGTKITLKDPKGNTTEVVDGKALVNLSKLESGSYTVEANVTGDYKGIYKAGFVLSTQPMGLKVEATSTTNNRIDVNVDADFFKTDDTKNVTNAKLVYNKVGETKTTEVSLKDQVKEDKVPVTLTVDAGKYEIRAIYDYTVNGKITQVVSNVVTVEVKGNTNIGNNNNGSGIVSGGSGSTTTGNSVGSTTITSTSSNTTSDSDTVNITLPSGVTYDSTKTPVAVKFIYKGLDGKTVTETKEQYSNVTVKFENGKVVVDGLVPGKDYPEISVDYTDNNGRTRTLILKDVKTTTTTELEKYLADVYTTVFKRPADEAGYHFHLNNLKYKKVFLREFLKNMLNEKEFNENYKTPETKVEALYAAIVARTPDQAGRDFWVAEYKKAVTTYGSEALALQAIVDRMVNEAELKTLAEKMNVQW